MHASTCARLAWRGVLLAFVTIWLMPAAVAAQPLPPKQGSPAVGVGAERPQNCRLSISGLVFQHVGDLLKGPPRPSGLRGIQVQLLDRAGNRVANTRTDREGRYNFRELCPATFTVCPGTPCPSGRIASRYSPASSEVRVPPIAGTIDFRLTEPPPLRQPPNPK